MKFVGIESKEFGRRFRHDTHTHIHPTKKCTERFTLKQRINGRERQGYRT